jgi:hypothetical protein
MPTENPFVAKAQRENARRLMQNHVRELDALVQRLTPDDPPDMRKRLEARLAEAKEAARCV